MADWQRHVLQTLSSPPQAFPTRSSRILTSASLSILQAWRLPRYVAGQWPSPGQLDVLELACKQVRSRCSFQLPGSYSTAGSDHGSPNRLLFGTITATPKACLEALRSRCACLQAGQENRPVLRGMALQPDIILTITTAEAADAVSMPAHAPQLQQAANRWA